MEEKRQRQVALIEGFTLMDDDFMNVVFDGATEPIELVLRIVLNKPGLKVISSKTQYQIRNLGRRNIWLDVLAEDEDGRRMDVEIQNSNKGASPKRARLHSALMDAEFAAKSMEYDDLGETWVVFITEKDVLKGNRPIYNVGRVVDETGEPFGDEAHIVYVNGRWEGDDSVGRLMHDFKCASGKDMNYGELADRVSYFKESEEGRDKMCEAMEKLIREEINEERIAMATRMIRAGKYTDEEIAEIGNLPLEAVRQLQKELSETTEA